MEFPFYRQLDQMDCGPTCLRMISKYFGRHYNAQTLRERAQFSREGVSLLGIAEAAESIGFKTMGVKIPVERLVDSAPMPCVLHWGQDHFVVLYKVEKRWSLANLTFLTRFFAGRKSVAKFEDFPADKTDYSNFVSDPHSEEQRAADSLKGYIFHIADPVSGLMTLSLAEFKKKWISTFNDANHASGTALLLEPKSSFYEEKGEAVKGIGIDQLLGYLWNYKRLVLQIGLGMLIGTVLSILLPLLTQSVVDVGIGTRNISFVYLILIAQVVLIISSTVVDFFRSWILLHISIRLNLTILTEFLSKLMRLPIPFFELRHYGDIMQRLGDHRRIESFLTGQTLSLLFTFTNLFVFGFMLAFYSFTIFTIATVASAIYGLWMILFLRQRRDLDKKRFDISAHNQNRTLQLIQGMQEIRLSGSETEKRWDWERSQTMLFKWSAKSLKLSQIQQVGALLINNGKNILITFLAAKEVIDGHLTLGGMMSIQYILGQFNAPVEQMLGFVQSWQDAKLSLERLNEVHQIPDEEPVDGSLRTEWNHTQSIKIDNLSFTYPGAGNEPVLRGINLIIPRGKTTAIVGTSGSGKTTFLKLLLKFYQPQSGRISLFHQDSDNTHDILSSLWESDNLTRFHGETSLETISHKAWRKQCGTVMQDSFLFSDTIARNIAVSDEIIDQQRLYDAAVSANIHEFIESLPLGYHTKIGAEGSGISAGQKQRILIARAIYKNPEILLFDEATNALDATNEAQILQNLEKFFVGKTVVIVAHRLSTVKNADQIVVLDHGQIAELGTHARLVACRGKYFELVCNQLELADG